MQNIKAKDLIKLSTEEIQEMFTGAEGGSLYYNKEKIVESIKNISGLYLGVLSYMSKKIQIRDCLDTTWNETGEPINKRSQMKLVEGTSIYVDTTNNTYNKFLKMKKCFEELSKKENIEPYEFEIIINNSNEQNKNNIDEKESMIEEDIRNMIEHMIKTNKQVIFTGAPGTGKTYLIRKYVEDNTSKDESRYKFVQFHASYDYTDFVEGLRPVPDKNGGNMFVRMDGTFKAFCRDIVTSNLTRLGEFDNSITSIETYFEYMKAADAEKKQKIYDMLDNTPYYFIIDEINRADLSRVFGELMFGLEESYREVHNRFDTQYKNLNTYCMNGEGTATPIVDDCFKKGFFVPYNLHIIGTMNDIDRSVESFDFALRRRFVWKDVKANDVMFESLKSMRENYGNDKLTDDTLKSVAEKIKTMNDKISNVEVGLTEAYHIGPAYFKDLVKVSDDEVDEKLGEIFDNRIEPILYEYMRGRRVNITDVLINPCKDALGV